MKCKLLTRRGLLLAAMAVCCSLSLMAQFRPGRNSIRISDPEFFKTDEARRIGDQVLAYQRCTGGWPKNIDMARRLTDKELAKVQKDKDRTDDSTIDNDATTMQMIYLARLYHETKDVRYRDAFRAAVKYLLSGQYENGGWPQFWPKMRDYQIHITYNDDAIVNTLRLFQEIIAAEYPYGDDLTDESLRDQLTESFNKGIDCILATQILVKGKPTVWCQQHDRETLLPAPARAFELPSYCSAESCSIVDLLMDLPNPSAKVKKAIHGAMKWFDTYKITGYRVERTVNEKGERNTRLVSDPKAKPMWARFYDLQRCEPFVCDRDGIPRRHLEDIGTERRNGYSWYSNNPADLYKKYNDWADKNDPKHKVKISLSTKGGNENGTFEMFRKPVKDAKFFDAVVKPGESIQATIEKAPEHANTPYKILIRKGTYNQKVVIDRPNICLVGEDRDSTVIVVAETSEHRVMEKFKGQDVHMGAIVLLEGADDCIINNLTAYNNYGTTVEQTTVHQMSIFGRATRTIITNCNVWADGNDALALWAQNGKGMYYHADLYLRCPGVDFLCPRGTCYATRCRFYGDSRAMIWHDGRDTPDNRLVITNSDFDAKTPTLLGRYHHDSQFILIKCHFSGNVLNENIHYAYSDKVLDPCVYGQRTYYYGCERDGGHSGWMKDNLDELPGSPEFWRITAKWTFFGKWDPEQRIRDLWNVLQY